VVQSNRGGQVTYHGPGQVVAYPLVDLRRLGIYVKEYVYRLESAVLKVLEGADLTGHRVAGAPGIYVRLADPAGHAALAGPADPHDPFPAWARWPRWASRSAGTAPTTAWR
jgi:lipoyl(octanoyl) transferase